MRQGVFCHLPSSAITCDHVSPTCLNLPQPLSMPPVQMKGDEMDGCVISSLRCAGRTCKAPTDLLPPIPVRAHPDQVPLLDLQPLHPAHGFKHALHCLWTGWRRSIQTLRVRVTFGHLHGQRHPWVEVAARSDPGQLVCSLGSISKPGGHIVHGPFGSGFSHGACPHHRRGVRPACARTVFPPS